MPELPRFDRPPLVEMILGLQFAPIEGMTSAHLGLFWQFLGQNWIRAEETEPVGQILFDEVTSDQLLGATLARQSSARRIRLYDASETRMLQVENGWLVQNWRRRSAGDNYPRFEVLLAEYQSSLLRLIEFAQAQYQCALAPRLWEVCYVNIIPMGELWSSPGDWPQLLPGIVPAGRPLSKVRGLRSGSAEWQFELLELEGTLRVAIDHLPTHKGAVLRLTQLARGPLAEAGLIGDRLQAARAAIVQTFAEITSEDAQSFWGRTT